MLLSSPQFLNVGFSVVNMKFHGFLVTRTTQNTMDADVSPEAEFDTTQTPLLLLVLISFGLLEMWN